MEEDGVRRTFFSIIFLQHIMLAQLLAQGLELEGPESVKLLFKSPLLPGGTPLLEVWLSSSPGSQDRLDFEVAWGGTSSSRMF